MTQLLLMAVPCLLGAILLLTIHLSRGRVTPQSAIALTVFHSLFCAIAGVFACDRIFGDEHRRGTLQGVLLLPLSPVRWLVLRLAFPLFTVGLAWAAAIPVYVLVPALSSASHDATLRLTLIPLCLGLAALPVVLLLPPDFVERMRRARSGGGRNPRQDADLVVRMLLLYSLVLSAQTLLWTQMVARFGAPQSVFGLRVPGWLPVTLIAAAILLASVSTALATISTLEARERWAARVRLAALTAIYYTNIGLFLGRFPQLPAWLRWTLLLIFPVVCLLNQWRAGGRREDRLAQEECAWVAARWDDPVLVKDFRVYTRFLSVRRTAIWECLGLAAILSGLAYLIVGVVGLSWLDYADRVAPWFLFFTPVILLGEICSRPFAAWNRERSAKTLPLLFLTALSSRQILWGRLKGAVLYAVLGHLPILVITLPASAWILGRNTAEVMPWVTAFSPVAALFAVAFACAVRSQSTPIWEWLKEDYLELVLGLVQVALLIGTAVAAIEVSRSVVSAWMLAVPVFTANAWLAWACYRLRARQLEALRCGDAPLRE